MRAPSLAVLFLCGIAVAARAETADAAPAYAVAPGLFDATRADLGLWPAAGARTSTVFAATENTDRYCNGAALVAFRGRLYAQWQSSARDEDSPDTWVAYSSSADGETWSAPQVLAPAGAGDAMRSSGGWWTDGRVLVAFVNVWPSGFASAERDPCDHR